MDEEINIRRPRGLLMHSCRGCGHLIKQGGARSKDEVVFQTLRDKGKWVATNLFHPKCYQRRKV